MHRLLAVILAGGMGERLSVLSQERAKPAVPFAGIYRIIDFTLSNCVNSGVHNIIVLTQYQPVSLTEHIGIGTPWGLSAPDRYIRLLQPYLAREESRDWYKGTADAVSQNLDRIEEFDADEVLILSGDHVYKMDYSPMLAFHRQNRADVTLAITQMPEEELPRFGTVIINDKGQVTRFQEKVKNPQGNLVSMGVYLFNARILRELLEDRTGHDFGRNVLPKIINKVRVFAYTFDGYWRDIGTVDSYWRSNMEVMTMSRSFLADAEWPIYTQEREWPPTKVGDNATVTDSLLASGCTIDGNIEHSIISPRVQVAEGAVIKDSIIMDETEIGRNTTIDRCILDKEVVIGPNSRIGYGKDFTVNRINSSILNTGLTIIGKRSVIPANYKIGRNCIVRDNTLETDLPESGIRSGETVRPRRRRTRPRPEYLTGQQP
jgi:glucose-1-phosphate adenylyltransferase